MEQALNRTEVTQELVLLRKNVDKSLQRMEKSVMNIFTLVGDTQGESSLLHLLKKEIRSVFARESNTFREGSLTGCDTDARKNMGKIDTMSFVCKPESWLKSSPVHSALSNHLIVGKIFEHLSFEALKSCREVCPSWERIGKKEMIIRNNSRMTLWDMKDDEKCRVGSRNSVTTLDDLLLNMKKPDSLRCSSFHIHSENMYRLAIPFFADHGQNIQSLGVKGLKSCDALSFVLKQCSNISSLQLDLSEILYGHVGFHEFFRNRNHRQIYWPKLLYLEIISHANVYYHGYPLAILEALIRGSPNLLELRNFNIHLVKAITRTNRIDLIKTTVFSPNYKNIRDFITFANHEPRLRDLTVECASMKKDSAVIQVIRKLLLSSCPSLVSLRTDPLGILGDDTIAQPFENLEELTVHNRNMSCALLPGGIGFSSRMFPKLRTVRFEIKVKSPSVYKLFALQPADRKEGSQNEGIPTVASIEFTNRVDKVGLQIILSSFPNITRMVLKETQFPVKASNTRIWELLPATLCALELFDSTFHFHTEKNFDFVFTGIHLLVCKHILRSTEGEQELLNHVRRKSWIGQLENLTKLRFTLHQKESYESHTDWTLSTLTAMQAFNKMERLQVTIAYDQQHRLSTELQTKLEPLEPFVAFQHEPVAF
ncbi:unnamed protein product [Allacma fusca]|uniref:F-box domain-containing protein n=1 Tax=Allacma fusca TaxID=39272 RepID=A0A8J2PYU6_9HEXA|nr:unnamed protein product [Allacma fusca]